MKKRLTGPGGARGAWLTAGRTAAGAVLLAVAVSACTGGGSSVPTIPAPTLQTSSSSGTHSGARTPSPTGQALRSSGSSASASATGRAGASASSSPHTASSPHASATASATASAPSTAPSSAPAAAPSSAPATPAYPTAAPEAGGGGTAGLQDSLLFGIGGLALFAGMGSLAYRRRLARKLRAGGPARQSPPDREPADR